MLALPESLLWLNSDLSTNPRVFHCLYLTELISGRPRLLNPFPRGLQLLSEVDPTHLYQWLCFLPKPEPWLPGTHRGSSVPSTSFTQLPFPAQWYSPGIAQETQYTLTTVSSLFYSPLSFRASASLGFEKIGSDKLEKKNLDNIFQTISLTSSLPREGNE